MKYLHLIYILKKLKNNYKNIYIPTIHNFKYKFLINLYNNVYIIYKINLS